MVDSAAFAPDGTQFARTYKKGLFNSGQTSIAEFLKGNQNRFATTSDSLLQVMDAVSENEGKYEAINTWDNAFLSFGIFQWTTGVGSDAGELPALLKLLQDKYPGTYQKYFGQYGLETGSITAPAGVAPRGYFRLGAVLLGDASAKENLRTLPWAYRFWLAGQDNDVREIQTLHAMKRINLFYRMDNRRIRGFHVGDYVTSEYGVALLLDQHVNRPGHVPRILANAVDQLQNLVDIDGPQEWGDDEEKLLLERYLALRANTSMTDSTLRAERIARQVRNGTISDKRNSFAL
jgi:hypothetical protein